MSRRHETIRQHHYSLVPISAGVMLLAVSVGVHAVPIQLSNAQFTAELSGVSTVVEDFEGFASGTEANPLTIANGTVTSSHASNALIVLDSFTFCGTLGDTCLTNKNSLTDVRTFSALPAGTTYWGVDLSFIRPTDTFYITVTGGSGVLSSTTTGSNLNGFAGFKDSLGLVSIAFFNAGTPGVGTGNYSFYNVTTASVSVPEPTTLSLLAIGLLGFSLARRRRRIA